MCNVIKLNSKDIEHILKFVDTLQLLNSTHTLGILNQPDLGDKIKLLGTIDDKYNRRMLESEVDIIRINNKIEKY